mmetsp:Transcript_72863/g.115334  ORF Transcript_72863/g.115334 Transcript_72863/m.115334 type:complete len:161 (-) Transcript_72863:120-602(-)|eukprot:CAMPEP_0169099406 /NCGR_PEP_ID=MMETSP1015-20121227/20541_1 /TAXON_ID=342587 /ORGANISM="Karlodinium micrum, Strain CCMP2283" /LENGTH=160 /DNA_ID=CAMNT_0009160287 /DNA_START=57 /DNA_END=539 /DNA_ORIENTATION=+
MAFRQPLQRISALRHKAGLAPQLPAILRHELLPRTATYRFSQNTSFSKLVSMHQTRSFCASADEALELEKRRKRLLWRAKSRGWLELDVLMGTFTEAHAWKFGHDKLDLLEEVLELENPDLFKWFTGQVPVPEEITSNEVMAMMVEYVKQERPGGLHAPR